MLLRFAYRSNDQNKRELVFKAYTELFKSRERAVELSLFFPGRLLL